MGVRVSCFCASLPVVESLKINKRSSEAKERSDWPTRTSAEEARVLRFFCGRKMTQRLIFMHFHASVEHMCLYGALYTNLLCFGTADAERTSSIWFDFTKHS